MLVAATAALATLTVGAVAPAIASARPGQSVTRIGAAHVAGAPRIVALPKTAARPNFVVGNLSCGNASLTPSQNIKGGMKLALAVKWLGSPTNKQCKMPITNCGAISDGSCSAGYWLIGIFCNTLAAQNIATGQKYCDTNNIVVLTDNNNGPNDATDNHGTSYNQCETVQTLGSIFGGLPGTLYCIPDGHGGDGWTESWGLGSTAGHAYGPAEQTGTSTPFRPTAKVSCPPSAADIKAGALPNTCAFVVMPVAFQYVCHWYLFGGCIPDQSLPHNGATELSTDHLAITFTYATTKTKAVTHLRGRVGGPLRPMRAHH